MRVNWTVRFVSLALTLCFVLVITLALYPP